MKIIFVILFLFSFLNIKVIFNILNYYLLIGVSLNHFNSKYLLKFVKVMTRTMYMSLFGLMLSMGISPIIMLGVISEKEVF